MSQSDHLHGAVHATIRKTLQDTVLAKLLEHSTLTQAQFETLLLDQIGSDIANKRLTREEMTRLRSARDKISRGAFFRTLQQARSNVSAAIHTMLLLGYSGLLETPSLAPYLEASERLRRLIEELRESGKMDPLLSRRLVDTVLEDLERAHDALRGKESDT